MAVTCRCIRYVVCGIEPSTLRTHIWAVRLSFFVCFLARQPPVGQVFLNHQVFRSHTTTHHNRQDSSGRVISPSQRTLPNNTQHSQQPCPRWDSNQQSQQTYVLDRAATGTGSLGCQVMNILQHRDIMNVKLHSITNFSFMRFVYNIDNEE